MKKRYITAIIASSLLATLSLQADTLLQYDFSTGLKPSLISLGITATPIEFGSFNGNKSEKDRGRSSAEKGNLYARVAIIDKPDSRFLADSSQEAIEQNSFFSIGIRAQADGISLDQFTANIGAQSIGKNIQDDYNIHFFLRSSADKFTSDLGKISYLKKSDVRGTSFSTTPWIIDLSSLSFAQNTRIEFRIYIYVETDAPSFDQTARLDDITITSK